jgi:3-hydroxybutyryl-CoA dehydratase
MISITRKFTLTQKDIERFGRIVGDFNPVHTDPTFAAKTRFKTPIAHGMTSICLLSDMLPKKYVVQEYEIKFFKPIFP